MSLPKQRHGRALPPSLVRLEQRWHHEASLPCLGQWPVALWRLGSIIRTIAHQDKTSLEGWTGNLARNLARSCGWGLAWDVVAVAVSHSDLAIASCMASNCAWRQLASSSAIATTGGVVASTAVAPPENSGGLTSSSTGSLEEHLVRRSTKPQVHPIRVGPGTYPTKAGWMGG
jgi:hypothetical protein